MRFALIPTFLFLFLANISAQVSERKEDLPMKFGISMGLTYSNAFATEQLSDDAIITNGLGFRTEILAEARLSKCVFVSPKLGVSFSDTKISMKGPTGEIDEGLLLPFTIDFAWHFQFKKESANRLPYFYLGPSIKLPIQSEKLDFMDFGATWTPSIDVGVSYDKAFAFFQFTPEFRYSIGLFDINKKAAGSPIYFHNFSFIFNFLG